MTCTFEIIDPTELQAAYILAFRYGWAPTWFYPRLCTLMASLEAAEGYWHAAACN